MAKLNNVIGAVWGKTIKFCGHDGTFQADIYFSSDAVTVLAAGPVSPDNLCRPAVAYDYHMVDAPEGGLWNPQRGIFMVPLAQFRAKTAARHKGAAKEPTVKALPTGIP